MNRIDLIDILKEASTNLGKELEKHFPGLMSLTYSEDSLGSSADPNFVDRMMFGIHMELLRAGLLKDIKNE